MRRRAFTLVEMLVVVAIILVLLAILLPVLLRARGKAQQAVCISNLSQLGKAFRMWAMDNDVNRMPHLPDELVPYVSARKLWVCPLDHQRPGDTESGPIYMSYVFVRTRSELERSGGALGRDREPWHHDGFNVLFSDGRVKWHNEAPF